MTDGNTKPGIQRPTDPVSSLYKPKTKLFPGLFAILALGAPFLLLVIVAQGTDSIIAGFVAFLIVSVVVTAPVITWAARALDTLQRCLKSMSKPEITERLHQKRGIEQIAADNLSTYGVPATVTNIVLGRAIAGMAVAGSPAIRRQAHAITAAQKGGPIIQPAEFIDHFSADKTVYFLDEPVEGYTTHPDGKRRNEGILLLSTTSLYFFARKQGDSSIKIRKNRTSQYIFINQVIAQLKERFRNEGSFAVPLREIVGLKSTVVEEAASKVNYLEVEQSNGARYWMKWTPSSFLRTDDIKEREALNEVVSWMGKIQWACAVEGRLLTGLGSQLHLVKTPEGVSNS